jgi:PIN domain nuclease of toxin-antitoxin system
MATSPVDEEVIADVGQAASSAVDSDIQPTESPAPEPELSEAEHHAKFLEAALQAADQTKDSKPKGEEQPEAPVAGSAPTPADPKTPAKADQPDTDAEEDDGEDRGEPFGKHPRWQKMVAARNEYREKAQAISQEVEALRPRADEYGLIEQYMSSNGLQPAEVIDGFKIMALMKTDPAAAREALQTHLHRIDSFLGNVLPPDLQRQVDEGFTTEEIARETVRTRNLLARQTAENQQYRQHIDQQATEQQQTQARQGMVSAVSQWEAQVRTSDPDYALKEQFVVDKLKLLRTQYRVETPEQAVQLAQMAYDQATKALRALHKKPEIRPSGAGSLALGNSTTAPAPKSFEDACLSAAGFTHA